MVSNIVLALTALAGFSSITYAAIIFLHILSIIYCRIHCNKKREPPPPDKAPGISILKPLVGIDPNLADNLESHFTVDYPKYELLFCINDECDPAISIVKPLMSKYPKVDCQLFIGGHPVGINPKINNMMPAYLASKYDFVMISDAGIRISNESIPDLVFHMKDNVGMVHQMPITVHRKGFAALVEMVYFGCAQARVYIGGNLLGFLVPTGMCCLLRKSVLEDGGGIAQFGKYIAEDYFIAKYMLSRGFKVAIGSYWGLQNHGFYSISSHQARMARWSKLRQAMLPTLYVFDPLIECIALGIFTAWGSYYLYHVHPVVFFLCHLLVWFLLDYIQILGVYNDKLPFGKFEFAMAWMTREILTIFTYLQSLWSPDFKWKTGTYKLKWGGEAIKVKQKDYTVLNHLV